MDFSNFSAELWYNITSAYEDEFSHYSNEQWENIFQQCMKDVDGTTDLSIEENYKEVTSKRDVIADRWPKLTITDSALSDALAILGLATASNEHFEHIRQCYYYSMRCALISAYPACINDLVFTNEDFNKF